MQKATWAIKNERSHMKESRTFPKRLIKKEALYAKTKPKLKMGKNFIPSQ